MAFSITLTRARSSCAGSTSTGGGVLRQVDVDAIVVGRDHVERAGDEAVDRPEFARRSCGASLESRELEEVRDEPIESLHLGEDRGDELVPVRRRGSRRCSRSTSLAVVIAVIGERRSWLTERSTAVFTASLRRSASASSASRRRRSSLARASAPVARSSAVARSDARIALTRAVTSGSTRSVESRNSRTDDAIARASSIPSFAEVAVQRPDRARSGHCAAPRRSGDPRRDGLEARLDLDALEQERGDVGARSLLAGAARPLPYAGARDRRARSR